MADAINHALPEPLRVEERNKLRGIARRFGAYRVALALGRSRHLVLSAMAGLDLKASDAAGIRAELSGLLARLEGDNP